MGTKTRIFAFCLLLCTSCEEERSGPLPAAEVAKVRVLDTDLPLPPGASNVWLRQAAFLDAIQMVRFDAPISEARAFARRVLGRDAVAGEGFGPRGTSGPDWWLDGLPDHGEGGSIRDTSRSVRLALAPRGANARVWLWVSAD